MLDFRVNVIRIIKHWGKFILLSAKPFKTSTLKVHFVAYDCVGIKGPSYNIIFRIFFIFAWLTELMVKLMSSALGLKMVSNTLWRPKWLTKVLKIEERFVSWTLKFLQSQNGFFQRIRWGQRRKKKHFTTVCAFLWHLMMRVCPI